MLKKLLIAIAVLLLLVVGGALVVPALLDWSRYKEEIASRAEEATGRRLGIDGDISLRLLPSPSLSADGVRLANLPDATAPEMATLKSLDLNLALLPLLGGRIEITDVTLVEPVISLEVLEDGRRNWDFAPVREREAPMPSSGIPAPAGGGLPAISLRHLLIEGGQVVYRDHKGKMEQQLEGIDAEISADSLTGPFKAQGRLRYGGLAPRFELSTGQLAGERAAPLNLQLGLEREKARLNFSGALSPAGKGGGQAVTGKLKGDGESLDRLLDALAAGGGWAYERSLFADRPFTLAAAVDISPAQGGLNDINFQLGDTTLSGAVGARFAEKTTIDATLSVNRLALDGLLEAPGTAAERAEAQKAKPADKESGKSGDLALPENLDGHFDLSIGAVALRGGIVEQLRVDAALSGGKLHLEKATALLPGGSDLAVAGTLAPRDGVPRFEGTVEAASDNLRALLDWLQLETAAVPMDRLRKLQLTSSVALTPEVLQVWGMDLRLDSTRLTGALSYALRTRPSFSLDMAADRLNLDAYLPAGKTADGKDAGADAAKKKEEAAKLDLAFLEGFDTDSKLKIGQLSFKGLTLQDVLIDAYLHNGALRLDQFAVGALGRGKGEKGARLRVTGSAGTFSTTPSFELGLLAEADRLRPLAREFDLDLPAGADKLGKARLDGRIKGTVEAADIDLAGQSGKLATRLSGKLANLTGKPRFDLVFDANHPDLRELIARLGGYEPAARQLGPLAFRTPLKGTATDIEMRGLQGAFGPASLTGDARLLLDGPRPLLSAQLAANRIIADLFLPRPRTGVKAVGGANGAGRGERWSRETLDFSALTALDAEISLTSPGLDWSGYNFDKPDLALNLKDGSLHIQRLSGLLFGGAAQMDARLTQPKGDLSRGPHLSLGLRLTDTDMAQGLAATAGITRLTGKFSIPDSRLETQGKSQLEMVENLMGDVTLQARDGTIDGIDMARLSERLKSLDRLADFGALLGATLTGGRTRLHAGEGHWRIEKGIARSSDTALELDASEATLQGMLDLPRWRSDLALRLRLTEHPKAPPFGIDLQGPLDNPRRIQRTSELESYMASRLTGTILRKGLGIDRKTAPAPTETEQPAPTPTPTPTPDKLAPAPVLEELLKGLIQKR